MKSTLFLCGAGNAEGVRLALRVNATEARWEKAIILDDDPAKKGRSILGVEIAGPFDLLKDADPLDAQAVNLVARTTSKRHAAFQRITEFGIPLASLIDPNVDTWGVEYRGDIIIYQNVTFSAGAFIDQGSVVFTGAVVGHGCKLGKFCIIAPGAVLNARIELGDGVYLGTNASILPDLRVGSWSTIGINSAVVHDVPGGATAMGVPAEVLISHQGVAAEVVPEAAAGPQETDYVAPRNETEKRLAAVWEKHLGRSRLQGAGSPIGVRDNYFALGGCSLTALNIFNEMETVFGKRLPLAALFKEQTIESLAALLRSGGYDSDWSSIVPINPNGGRTPFFCVHGAGGNVLLYQSLAGRMGNDQPFYGIQSRGLDGSKGFHTSIEEMASDYIDEMLHIQPAGPYLLGGYCMGGTIAYEMSRQLIQRGHRVALVALLDTYNVNITPAAKSRLGAISHLAQNAVFHLKNIRDLPMSLRLIFMRDKVKIARERAAERIIRLKGLLHKAGGNAGRGPRAVSIGLLQKINEEAASKYIPKPLEGVRVTLFKPKAAFRNYDDANFGWGDLVKGDLRVIELPVYPKGMLVEPFVETLADRMREEFGDVLKQKQIIYQL